MLNKIITSLKSFTGLVSIIAAMVIPGNAAMVELVPSATDIRINEVFSVDIIFTDNTTENGTNMEPADIAGFNLEVTFDNQLLEYVSAEQFTNLDGLQGEYESYRTELNDAGNLILYWVSDYLGDFSSQPNQLKLGTLVFKGKNSGDGIISFVQSDFNGLSDPNGNWIQNVSYGSATVSVPEPSLLSLLGLGLTSLLALRGGRRQLRRR